MKKLGSLQNINIPWSIQDCQINNNNISFYVQLVHVDQYNDKTVNNYTNQIQNRRAKYNFKTGIRSIKSRSLSVKKNYHQSNINKRETQEIEPIKILKSVPLPMTNQASFSHKKFYSEIDENNYNKFAHKNMLNKTLKVQNSKMISTSYTDNRVKRSKTEYVMYQKYCSEKKDKQNKFANQNYLLRQKLSQLSIERNSLNNKNQNVSFTQNKIKKLTIKDLLQYRTEKTLKKKQILMRKFKLTFNKAKFYNANAKNQTVFIS